MTDDHLPQRPGDDEPRTPTEQDHPEDRQMLIDLADELRTVAPVTDGPSAERVEALRAAVARRARTADDVVRLADRRPAPSVGRWAVVAGRAVAAVVLLLAGIALGTNPPDGLRPTLVSLGLPVDSAAAADLHRSIDELGLALDEAAGQRAAGEVSAEALERVAETDAAMLEDVRALDEDELAELRPVAHQVHLRAVSLFEEAGRRLPTAQPSDLQELYGSS